jgi:Leucine-rich repeat (LRR) protein
MESLNDFFHSFPPGCAIGFASNGGTKRYLIEVESTTGFVAWRLDDGTILVNAAETVDLPASQSLAFWSCAGYQDTTPAGEIVSLDCHANELNHLNIRRLKGLRFLDCCYNRLTEIDLTGLADLEVLDADNNQLTALDVRHLSALRILNCASNPLATVDVSALTHLDVFNATSKSMNQ